MNVIYLILLSIVVVNSLPRKRRIPSRYKNSINRDDPNARRKAHSGRQKSADSDGEMSDDISYLSYERYLRQVVKVLENDESFKKKLENATVEEIQSGDIASHLGVLPDHVRSMLDEHKRQEIERLRAEFKARRQFDEDNKISNLEELKAIIEHVDDGKLNEFTEEDLRKLIVKSTADLHKIDEERKKMYKEEEMKRELEFRRRIKDLPEDQQKIELQKHKEKMETLKKHPKVYEPGHKKQLEEIWKEQDELDPQDFDPKTFFKLHDKDGNDILDPPEIEALLYKEVERIFDNSIKNGMTKAEAQRAVNEEVNRMREYIVKEVDVNNDGSIEWNEFIRFTQKDDFKKEHDYKTVIDEMQYNENELLEYEERLKKEMASIQAKKAKIREAKQKMQKDGEKPDEGRPEYYKVDGEEMRDLDAQPFKDYDDDDDY